MIAPATRRLRRLSAIGTIAVLAAAACSSPPNARVEPLRVIVTGEIELPSGFIENFAERRGIPVRISREDSASGALEAIQVSPDRPVADLIIGVPDVTLGDAAGSVVNRELPADVRPEIGVAAPRSDLAPLTLLDMCLVWDRAALVAAELSPPPGPAELLDPVWSGRVVIPDPAESFEGRLFLEALRLTFGDDPRSGWVSAVGTLLSNDLVVAPTWRSAFDEHFTSVATPDGPPVTWGGAALPAVVLRLVDPLPDSSPLGISTGSGCVRSVIGAVIPENASRPESALALVADLQTPEVQNLLLDNRGGLPVAATALPEAYTRFAFRPAAPSTALPTDPDQPGVVAIWGAIMAEAETEAPG